MHLLHLGLHADDIKGVEDGRVSSFHHGALLKALLTHLSVLHKLRYKNRTSLLNRASLLQVPLSVALCATTYGQLSGPFMWCEGWSTLPRVNGSSLTAKLFLYAHYTSLCLVFLSLWEAIVQFNNKFTVHNAAIYFHYHPPKLMFHI